MIGDLKPIAEGLWTEQDPPRLIGARHIETGEIIFPMPQGDAAQNYVPVPLSRTGTLWSWTIQGFRPKSPPYAGPEAFKPFALGYVELPGEVIIESRLTQLNGLIIGMPLELVIIPFDESRNTFAFKPKDV
jgi:uncharacterized protein